MIPKGFRGAGTIQVVSLICGESLCLRLQMSAYEPWLQRHQYSELYSIAATRRVFSPDLTSSPHLHMHFRQVVIEFSSATLVDALDHDTCPVVRV